MGIEGTGAIGRAGLAGLICALGVAWFPSAAAANHSTVRLFSGDSPGSTTPLEVLGPNMGNINPGIALTPDGRAAAFSASGRLFKSTDAGTELVGVGPRGIAEGFLCGGEHNDCHQLISPDGKRVVFETRTSLVSEDQESCTYSIDTQWTTCGVDVYERTASGTRSFEF